MTVVPVRIRRTYIFVVFVVVQSLKNSVDCSLLAIVLDQVAAGLVRLDLGTQFVESAPRGLVHAFEHVENTSLCVLKDHT